MPTMALASADRTEPPGSCGMRPPAECTSSRAGTGGPECSSFIVFTPWSLVVGVGGGSVRPVDAVGLAGLQREAGLQQVVDRRDGEHGCHDLPLSRPGDAQADQPERTPGPDAPGAGDQFA